MKPVHKLCLSLAFVATLALAATTFAAGTPDAKTTGNSYISPFGPYQLNYIIPFNYSTADTSYDQIYPNSPNKKYEVKFQISGQTTLIDNLFHKPLGLNLFYTQVSYWQFYAKSAYFRETNYNPGLFFHFHPTFGKLPFRLKAVDLGAMHQSNGRGEKYERSWNRVFMDFTFQISPDWCVSVRPWYRVHILEAKDYNPDMVRYLGDGDIRINYHHNNFMASLMFRNVFESGFARGAEELDLSFPLYSHFHMFLQTFSGYGQSLIAYNHYTNSVGIGFSLFSDHNSKS